MPRYLAAVSLLGVLLLAACSRELDRVQVAEFIDRADQAARKRYAPDICALRGKDFESHLVFHAHDADEPTELDMTRKLFCREAGSFSHLRQYQLERKSMSIQLARDRKTAIVTAEYLETLPFYEPDRRAVTPDDFMDFQVVENPRRIRRRHRGRRTGFPQHAQRSAPDAGAEDQPRHSL
jgi:hypothetical protein